MLFIHKFTNINVNIWYAIRSYSRRNFRKETNLS